MEPKKKVKKVGGFSTEVKIGGFGQPTMRIHNYEPRRKFRYLIQIPLGDQVVEFFVNAERPSQRVEQIDNSWGLNDFTRPLGRLQWDPIRIIFRDRLGNMPYTEVMNRLETWFGSVAEQHAERTFKKNVTIQMLDPVGVVVESWNLIGAFPSLVQIDTNYSMDGDNVMYDVEMDLVFDYCNINM